KSAIYLLEVLGNAYLVGETQGGLHRLADLPKDTDLSSLLPPDAEQGKPRSFSSVLDAQGE
ncbi:MAG: flagellar biosynthetic protein FliO, partial [Chlamydiia bacterium]|nr:flagellar biosynthetic protein FliO [Chlamydiia bacterium]